ncbi:MAG: RNase adapter RapZ [Trueperaceae bacterium]
MRTDADGGAAPTKGGTPTDGGTPTAAPLVILTGVSGAGKTTAMHALEDVGFYTVDNLPPSLWLSLVEGGHYGEKGLCVCVDIRTRAFLGEAPAALAELKERGHKPKLLFLDASDEVLVKRYNFTRRSHPVSAGTLTADLASERSLLGPLRQMADDVIDTTNSSARALTQLLWDRFAEGSGLLLRLVSFGFKRGMPTDVDTVLDVRGMPNPFYDEVLRPLPGTDASVQRHVFSPESLELYHQLRLLVRSLAFLAESGGRSNYSVAVGCTGGQHRSVAVIERLSHDLAGAYRTQVQHRDLADALREHAVGATE